MKSKLFPLVAAFGMFVVHAQAQSAPAPHKAPLILDLSGGKILGAGIGMNEATAREGLVDHQVTGIEKVTYPGRSLLQSRDILGLIFNFDDSTALTSIYTNSPNVVLSNGLKLGQTIKEFAKRLGPPRFGLDLPSGVGVELIFSLGDYELGVIVLDSNPDIAHALTLRKRTKPPDSVPSSILPPKPEAPPFAQPRS